MKNLFLPFLFLGSITYGQNYFPSSGNAKIFAVDEAWAEGLSIVKPSGWSGIRLARNNPSGGNYAGNWAIGYNASTGNDFSISNNYNGTQYDGIFHINSATRNIGIGTTSPGAPLHIQSGTPTSVQGLNSLTKFTVDAASGGFAEFRNTADNNTYTGMLFTDNNLGGYVAFRNYPDDKLHLGAYGGMAFEVGSDNNVGTKTERMRIDANGNVGIGTTNPVVKLQVNITGSSNTNYASYSAADIGYVLQNSNPTNNNFSILSFSDASNWGVSDIGAITNHSNHTAKLFFSTRPVGSGPVQRMLIDENGKVGIGTMSPDAQLSVNGQIHATEVKVTTTVPGPDYVFEKSYSLPTLEEVKSYIDQNKHLPEVPSAKEMEKNGVMLGEMNMLLLKKVEELTLYMIEQKIQIEKMQLEINQLKK